MGCSNLTTLLEKQPDAVRRIDRCAWHTQFREMGLSVYDDVDVSTLQEEVWEYYWDHPEISGNWDRETYDAIQSAA